MRDLLTLFIDKQRSMRAVNRRVVYNCGVVRPAVLFTSPDIEEITPFLAVKHVVNEICE